MKLFRSGLTAFPSFYYGWLIVGVSLLMNLAGAPAGSPVIFSFFIAPMSDDLGWSRGALSWSVTFRTAAAGIAAPLIGIMVDRFGSRWMGVVAGLVAGVCLVAYGSVHQLWYFYLLAAMSGAVGLGGPGGAILTSVPIAKWFIAKRGRAFAIAGIGGPAGTALGIPLAQLLINSVGWRQAWVIFGILTCVLVVIPCALFMRRTPEDMGLKPDGADDPSIVSASPKPRISLATNEDWTASQALGSPTLWLILTAFALMGLALNGTLVHRVAFWKDIGMSPALVAFGTAVDPFTVVFSGMVFGIIGERVHVRYLGLIAGIGFAASMLPMVFATGHAYSILAHNFIWGSAAGAYITSNNLILPNYFGRKFLGAIRGISLPVSIGASGLGAPIYGYLIDSGLSPTIVWMVSLSLFFAAGVLLFLAKPPSLTPQRRATQVVGADSN